MMKYKYKKSQIFGKRLNVPKQILQSIYHCTLHFSEYIEYKLEDKVPIDCLIKSDREIVERFGIEACEKLDWELLNHHFYHPNGFNVRSLLMEIDPKIEDINSALYKLIEEKIDPRDYSPKMKAAYSKRFFSREEIDQVSPNTFQQALMSEFNDGELSLEVLIRHWELFKDKDLTLCLRLDSDNDYEITSDELKQFMEKYQTLVPLISEHGNFYDFIHHISLCKEEEEQQEFIKSFTDGLLEKTLQDPRIYSRLKLTEEEYHIIFRYSSFEEYFTKVHSSYYSQILMNELKTLPDDYLETMPIPITALFESDVIFFVIRFGLKNIYDFDNECEHYFTSNDCEMLRLMDPVYFHYAGDEIDPRTADENYHKNPYTKEEFYEAMRRMLVHGPTGGSYFDNVPSYRTLGGAFRSRFHELFLADDAPQELQDLFYTKSLTPQVIREHPEYIDFLRGKNMRTAFKSRYVKVGLQYGEYQDLYDFMSDRTNFDELIQFLVEYGDILDAIYDPAYYGTFEYEIKYAEDDDLQAVQKKIGENFRKIVIQRGISYSEQAPKALREQYPNMFLREDAPQELKDAFYSRTIDANFMLSNPVYIDYLRDLDLEVLFKYMPIQARPLFYHIRRIPDDFEDFDMLSDEDEAEDSIDENIDEAISSGQGVTLVKAIKHTFGQEEAFDILLSYGKYLEVAYQEKLFNEFKYNPNCSKEELLNSFDKRVYQVIISGAATYDENVPEHFREKHPNLFLDKNAPKEIRDKFYNREFTLEDFNDNPDLLETCGTTNIVCGFPTSLSWMIPLFEKEENQKIANFNRLKVIAAYTKIHDVALQQAFQEFVMDAGADLDMDKIEFVSDVLSRLSLSNSSEIFTFRKQLAVQILKSDNPIETLNRIEAVFIKNNIPTVGKIFSCFQILHPDFQGFDFNNSMVSPTLKEASTRRKKILVFSDLIKASLGSNNRSINQYLDNIELGSSLYSRIRAGEIQFDELFDKDKEELQTFRNHLVTLYNSSAKSKIEGKTFVASSDVLNDIIELSKALSPDGSLDYNLGDRVIDMFCGFTGIHTIEEARSYIHQKVHSADSRNRDAATHDMTLEPGDLVKGIGSISYLGTILQNGSVSKEFLGANANSDCTPLDTDASMILSNEGSTSEKISRTTAASYGPIWIVLKKSDKFITTRTHQGEHFSVDTRNTSKMELFYTGVCGESHYGIRTGFASSDIDYIVMDSYDPRVGLEIAMNGFYIPIANSGGKIIFTPDDYDRLREKMQGLSYYGETEYHFSDHLVTEDTREYALQIESSNEEVKLKRERINQIIQKSLDELGLKLKTEIDGNLSEGFVELIDTGSTGRGTNKPGDGDFDFMMRLDRSILLDRAKLDLFKQTLLKNLGKDHNAEITGSGDFRLKGVEIAEGVTVDIDITFAEKTDKVVYSTDMALQDRLETIKTTNPEKYPYVVANILLAKRILKEAEVYKPNRGEVPQGGLGGVGIENWILQNGGSFEDAARSFLATAEGRSFEEFQRAYPIWDFGENHLAEKRGHYAHDNFVSGNMSPDGYERMIKALRAYLDKIDKQRATIDEEEKKRG